MIIKKIRELRFFANEMTQSEMAKQVEVTRQTTMVIEKEKYSPSLEVALKIARFFDKPLNEVFFCEPPQL